jgi:biopolymer transport protein TolQ
MSSFMSMGREGSASLAVVAPGIAEALIVTAAGLFAAIPAVIGYNLYVNRVQRFTRRMDSFSLELLNALERNNR